jgi:hypothetical protein
MLNKNIISKIIFTFLLLIANFAYGQSSTNQSVKNLTLRIVNLRTLPPKVQLPFHPFEYLITLPNEEKADFPLNGKVGSEPIIVKVYRADDANIISDLKVTDPSLGNRVIWDGRITLDKITHEIQVDTRTKHVSYIINLKASSPSDESPVFEIDMLSL